VAPITEGKANEIMQVFVSFRGLGQDEITIVRRLFNSLPFTWLEAGTEARDYYAFMDIPIQSFNETMSHIEARIGVMKNKFEMTMLDPTKTESMNVPEEMYDRRYGWRLLGLPEDPMGQSRTDARTPRRSDETRQRKPSNELLK
jgi:hypothetical protein